MTNNEDYQKRIFVAEYEKGRPFKGDEVASVLLRIVKPYIVGDILDIGAGSGALLKLLKAKGFDAKGIDLYTTSNDIQKGSLTDMPFGDAGFDTVFCCDVIEHLADEQLNKGLSEVARVLRKSGRFIITTPYDEDLKSCEVVCPKCGHEFHRYGHLQSFDNNRLQQLITRYGFEPRFMRIYAMGVMTKLPLGRYYHFILKRFDFEFIQKTIVGVWEKS